MENSIEYLTQKEMKIINGGGFWSSLFGAAAFHVAMEAYDDWAVHAQAFNDGRASVK